MPRVQRREVLLEEFYLLPDKDIHRENDLRPGEILTAVVLPKLAPGIRSVHLKQGEKDSFDWPIADVAVLLDCDPTGCAGRLRSFLELRRQCRTGRSRQKRFCGGSRSMTRVLEMRRMQR